MTIEGGEVAVGSRRFLGWWLPVISNILATLFLCLINIPLRKDYLLTCLYWDEDSSLRYTWWFLTIIKRGAIKHLIDRHLYACSAKYMLALWLVYIDTSWRSFTHRAVRPGVVDSVTLGGVFSSCHWCPKSVGLSSTTVLDRQMPAWIPVTSNDILASS